MFTRGTFLKFLDISQTYIDSGQPIPKNILNEAVNSKQECNLRSVAILTYGDCGKDINKLLNRMVIPIEWEDQGHRICAVIIDNDRILIINGGEIDWYIRSVKLVVDLKVETVHYGILKTPPISLPVQGPLELESKTAMAINFHGGFILPIEEAIDE